MCISAAIEPLCTRHRRDAKLKQPGRPRTPTMLQCGEKDIMQTDQERPVVKIAPNNPVFDLPVIVGIEEGVFAKAGLDVAFTGTYADREKDTIEKAVLERTKEGMFECGSADSYNVCEWASI